MSRDTASRKLSDSDFWQICREMHSSNGSIRVPSTTLGVPNDIDRNMECTLFDGDMFDVNEIEAIMSPTDDCSLENLYAKQKVAHHKLLVANGNSVNTQKILDTIELICAEQNNGHDGNAFENMDMENGGYGDAVKNTTAISTTTAPNNEIDAINNADDLLLKIADSVQQLKANVNQIDATRTGSTAFDGDLIDFSDEWTRNCNGESGNNRHCVDNEMAQMKATQPANAGNLV